MKRFEALEKNPHISDEALDALGTVELSDSWMSDHHSEESIRTFDEEGRQWSAMTDLFNPGDISSNMLRGQWIDRVKGDAHA